ncbi:MAG: class I SAM-dependent methyltransferase [Betaproteobacteria bacterium]|nr:class I SAM-dependent methyltransferase [Betaproteobacteria bacterium]
MDTTSAPGRTDAQLRETNRRFYDALWRDARLVEPRRFNTWPLVSALVSQLHSRLEVAPGLRPRLPVEGTHFVDLSEPAIAQLRPRAASVTLGSITALPFVSGKFDLVCAFDIVEHVDDEDAALSELSRVCDAGGVLLIAVPLHPSRWTPFDDFVGHCRRYEPQRLLAKLSEYGFSVESSAVYGMQPKSSRLLDLGMWWLTHRREQAMWWYNRVMMPLGVRFQKKLLLCPGMIDAEDVDEVLLVCRKRQARPVRFS